MTDPLVRFKRRPTPRAFEALIREASPDVLAAAFRVLGDRSLAEDVAQEVFMKALDERWPGRTIRSGIGLLVSTAIFRAKTMLRSEERRRVRERRVGAERTDSAESAAYAVPIEDRWLLDDCIAELDEAWRESIELRYFGGLEVGEIAAATDTSPRTVRDRLERARSRLATQLRGAGALALASRFEDGAGPIPELSVREGWIEELSRRGRSRLQSASGAEVLTKAALGLRWGLISLAVLGIGGMSYWLVDRAISARGDETPIAAAPPLEEAAQNRAPEAPARRLESEAVVVVQPEPAGVETSTSATTDLEVRVLTGNGEFVDEGQLLLAAAPSSVAELTRRVSESPQLVSRFEWLMRPLALEDAGQNPLLVEDLPDILCGLEFSAQVVIDGEKQAEKNFRLAPGTRTRVDLDFDRLPSVGVIEERVGPLGLRIEVVDERGDPVVEGALSLDAGLSLLAMASEPAVGIRLAPFAWLHEPIDLARRNPLVVEGLPEELAEVSFVARVRSPLGFADPVRLRVSREEGTVARIVVRPLPTREVFVIDAETREPLGSARVVNLSYFESLGALAIELPALGQGSALTDPAGRAEVEVIAADSSDQEIYVYKPGYATKRRPLPLGSAEPAVIELSRLERTGALTVEVLGSDGAGVEGVSVLLRPDQDSISRSALTDVRGRVEFELVETGRATVTLPSDATSRFSGTSYSRSVQVEVRADEVSMARLGVVGDARVVVEVVDESGNPLRWVRVGLFGPSTGDARTGWKGTTDFSPLEAGDYRLIVDRAPRRSPIDFEFELAHSETRTLRFVRGTATVSGRFLGESVLFSEVELIAEDGSIRSDTCGADGEFAIGYVAAGRYQLIASRPRRAPERRVIDVEAGVDLDGLEFDLQPGSVLEVTFDPRIEAFDVEIRVFDAQGRSIDPEAFGGAWWRSASLAAEVHRVELRRGAAPPAVTSVRPTPDKAKRLVFDPHDLTLKRQPN